MFAEAENTPLLFLHDVHATNRIFYGTARIRTRDRRRRRRRSDRCTNEYRISIRDLGTATYLDHIPIRVTSRWGSKRMVPCPEVPIN